MFNDVKYRDIHLQTWYDLKFGLCGSIENVSNRLQLAIIHYKVPLQLLKPFMHRKGKFNVSKQCAGNNLRVHGDHTRSTHCFQGVLE